MTLPTLRILCFGNSLTAGFWQYGLEYHPYAGKLKEKLESADIDLFPGTNTRTQKPRILVDVDGMPGDLVVTPPGCFLGRMKAKCTLNQFVHSYVWYWICVCLYMLVYLRLLYE
jgi:hypothetical protein